MRVWRFVMSFIGVTLCCSCGLSGDTHKTKAFAPVPPQYDMNDIVVASLSSSQFDARNNVAQKASCHFSSFHRKNTIGYEFDDQHQLSFQASPSFDMWDPSDFEMRVGFKFTKSLGGVQAKRPDCVYGSGYYGLVPYIMNDGVHVPDLPSEADVKSYLKEKIDQRRQRYQEKEQENNLGVTRGL